ncbi:MAG: hypothetical protein RJB26_564 [Pseudomonadota bacterium]|jgi:hypothetical protein
MKWFFFRRCLPLVAALCTAGCATPFYDAKTAGPQIETALGLASGSVAFHASCQFGQAGRASRAAEFFPAACAVDGEKLYVVEWDEVKKAYRAGMDVRFAAMESASYYKGLFDEVQLPIDGGVLSLLTGKAQPLHAYLVAHGVKDAPSGGEVLARVPPQPTTIYIYVPR